MSAGPVVGGIDPVDGASPAQCFSRQVRGFQRIDEGPGFGLADRPGDPGGIQRTVDGEGLVDAVELVVEVKGNEGLVAGDLAVEGGGGFGGVEDLECLFELIPGGCGLEGNARGPGGFLEFEALLAEGLGLLDGGLARRGGGRAAAEPLGVDEEGGGEEQERADQA